MLVVRLSPQHFVSLRAEFERRVAPFNEKFLHACVRVIEQQLAGRGLAVTTGAPGLLVIGLDTSGNIEVHHEADVGPVDPHPECVRRHDNVASALHELVLRFLALIVVHPAVVKNAGDVRELERFGDCFDAFPGRAINDPGPVLADQGV